MCDACLGTNLPQVFGLGCMQVFEGVMELVQEITFKQLDLMNSSIPVGRRLLSSVHNARPCFQRAVVRSIRRQHTETQPSPPAPAATKSRQQSSRASTAIFLVAGLGFLGYGFRDSFTNTSSSNNMLNKSSFTPFNVISKEKVSSTCSIFTLEQPDLSGDSIQEMWKKGVWSIEIKQPQLQIARSYTPLPPIDPSAPKNQLRLLVRRENRGEMSNYIHNTPENGTLELRGPAVEHHLPHKVDRVVFLAGGTGIAPATQVAHSLQDSANVSILWACRKREDCLGGKSDTTTNSASWLSRLGNSLAMTSEDAPPAVTQSLYAGHAVRQLDHMKTAHGAPLKVDYFVDEEGTFIQPNNVIKTISQQEQEQADDADNDGEKLIFVSGPEGFLNYWAGPKVWRDGKEVQGPLGGALSRMDLKDWKVVKL